MPSARSEAELLRTITREVDALLLGAEDVPAGWLPTGPGEGLRSPADQLRQAVPPVKRQAWLRNAIARSGVGNYLVRYGRGKAYKAVIRGRIFTGSFAQVWDQTAPFLLSQLN